MGNADGWSLEPEYYRGYLRALAESRLGRRARAKVDPSDIVQQTLLDAYRSGGQFRGSEPSEMAGWLRRLLTCNLADAVRSLGRARRDASREIPIDAAGHAGSPRVAESLACGHSSPSQRAQRRESADRLALALSRLPEASRKALTMRHIQGLSVAEIGEALGRTPAAVAGLLKRGLAELRRQLPDEDSPRAGGQEEP